MLTDDVREVAFPPFPISQPPFVALAVASAAKIVDPKVQSFLYVYHLIDATDFRECRSILRGIAVPKFKLKVYKNNGEITCRCNFFTFRGTPLQKGQI